MTKRLKIIFLATVGILFGLTIAGANFWLIKPWFGGQGPINLGSIEVSYVSMGRFLRDFSPHLSFGPFWYLGFPFHLFYTPLLPYLEWLLNRWQGIELWQAYRLISGAGLVLAPVSLFLFTWQLTKKIVPALFASLAYTFLPSLFYFILPSGEVARDIISTGSGFFDPRRLVILARWGEGPHTLSLVFLPLAGLFYLRMLRGGKGVNLVLASVFLGLTALTNAVGFYAAIMLLSAVFFGCWAKKPKKIKKIVGLSALTAVVSYGLVAFWYNLSFMTNFFGEGGGALGGYASIFPWGFVAFVLGVVILYYLFRLLVKDLALMVSLIWWLILFLIVYVFYASAPPHFAEQRIQLVPQALRLMTTADMALSVLLAAIMAIPLRFLDRKKPLVLKLSINLVCLVTILFITYIYGIKYLPWSQKAVAGEVDIAKTGEYEIAQWLDSHVDKARGERVLVAGNYGFYLNYFTDVWQLRGGLFQAMTHHWPGHIYYQIVQGEDEKASLAWLQAANIRYLVVNLGNSRELYKEYKHPEKFKDLKQVFQKQGDLIYELPYREPVKVVNLGVLKQLATPEKADDLPPLLSYTDWLDQSEPASFKVVNNDQYQIRAKVGPDQGILVQMTAGRGFRATSSQGQIKIKKDPLGFMVLEPAQPGDYQINLTHSKTWVHWLGYTVTLMTVASLLVFPLIKTLRERI